ncbi:MAG: hypothetical protein H6909_01445 [Rickettsiaceae bacterium]|nr:hypothetical protein [Rickettsiaceae bacterium]
MHFNVDIAIIFAFLAVTIFVGMGHGKKIKTLEDYALGGRDFSTAALIATIVATYASGSGFMTTLTRTYRDGLHYLFASIGVGVWLILMAFIILPRMKEFLGKVSIAHAMGGLYGKAVQVVVALASSIGAVGSIAVQFKVFGNIFSYFLYINDAVAIIIAGVITTAYSAFGGIRAVTFTDVFQFFAFGIIIPLLSFVIWNNFYNEGYSIITALQVPKYNISNLFSNNNPKLIETLIIFSFFAMPGISGATFQRISMGRDIAQVKKAFIISGVCLIFIKIAIAWIPFLIYIMKPDIVSKDLLGYIIDTYGYNGLKGMIIVAIIAFTMSTADSKINAASVMFTNDICKVFVRRPIQEILISRIFAFIIGFGAIGLALTENDLLNMLIFTGSFATPIVTPLFLMSIFGFRTSSKSVLLGSSAAFIFTFICHIWSVHLSDISKEVNGITLQFVSMILNVSITALSHYLLSQPGGWVKTQGTEDVKKQRLERRVKWLELLQDVKNFNLINYLRKTSPKYDDMYVRVGIYFIIYTLTTMYSTHTNLLGTGRQLLSWIYPFMLITGTMMTIYHLWPSSIPNIIKEKIIQIWWPLSLFYMLIVFSGFFVLLSDFSLLQTSVAFLNLLVIITLYKWQMSVISLPLGLYLSNQLYNSVYGSYNLKFDPGSPEAIMLYLMLLCGTAIIMFVKPKQEYLEATESTVGSLQNEVTMLVGATNSYMNKISSLSNEVVNLHEKVDFYSDRVTDQEKEIERLGATSQKILNNVTHELRLPVGNVMNFASLLSESLGDMNQEQLKELSDEVFKNSERLSSMIMNMLDLATLDIRKVQLAKRIINLGELVKDRVERCQKIYLEGKPIDIKLTISPEILIAVDPNYVKQIVDNLIINAIKYSDEGLIEVEVREELSANVNGAVIIIKDQGIGIPKEEIFDIFTPFKTSSRTFSKAEGRGVGLSLCKTAAEAHGGHIEVRSGAKGAKFTVWLPITKIMPRS